MPTPTQIPALDEAMQHLDIVSNDLNQILQEYDTQLTQMEQNKQNLQSAELDLGTDILRSSERYEYFQSLSSYVNDLGEFLDAKVCDECLPYRNNVSNSSVILVP